MESHDDSLHTIAISKEQLKERDWRSVIEDPVDGFAKTGLLIDLYQLSLQLLMGQHSDDVIDTALKLLLDRTGADVIGVTFDSGDGKQKPLSCLPDSCPSESWLSRSLVRRVIRDDTGIWIGDPHCEIERSKIDSQWSDVICVPLRGDDSVGTLCINRRDSLFQQSHFDFSSAAGRLLAIGLARIAQHDQIKADAQRIASRNADANELIGDSPIMQKLKTRIARVGQSNGSVLIRGESGSGKELVARAVHRSSLRGKRPMLTVNCAAIPRDLIESQLFGHKKGSFTGAEQDHIGWFEQAHTGTLFLDEIGELTLEGQAKLLRILEGHPFLPVGATKEVMVDVRVIAATNRDLAEFVREKKFREDLFYRLSVFELNVPPLRDRGDDLDRLIDYFLDHFRRENARANLGLSDEARQQLREYPWPGNVRQLRNVIDSAVVMADDPMILIDDLGLRDAGLSRLETLRIDMWEERLIRKALKRTDGSVPDAAKLLGISRATAYRKIADYKIDR
jgi:Nif-specific regulatory protein